MKIIGVDNFDRETRSDILVAVGITSVNLGEVMVKALNEKFCSHSGDDTFFKLVPDDHKLFKYEP